MLTVISKTKTLMVNQYLMYRTYHNVQNKMLIDKAVVNE